MTDSDTIRQNYLLGLALIVLRDLGGRAPRIEIARAVKERAPFNAKESSSTDSGKVRGDLSIYWGSTAFRSIGWLNKDDGIWSLTDAGLKAMETIAPDDLYPRAQQHYLNQRNGAQGIAGRDFPTTAAVPQQRAGVIAATAMSILAGYSGPVHFTQVMERIPAELDLTPEELGRDRNGELRYVSAAKWYTIDLVHAGWMRKLNGPWEITDEGRAALDQYPIEEIFDQAKAVAKDQIDDQASEDSSVAKAQTGGEVAGAIALLAEHLHMSEPWVAELIGVLTTRKQLVLYGPPGTGKTYVAQALADHLSTGESGAYTLVQFHPSYSYEDFFEGYRPSIVDGHATSSLKPGPLRTLAARAVANPDTAHVLVIDEINRANIAKVFGELYFLLEYRDASIALQYADEREFTLPKNLYIIATMNTVDRSIALVDAAIRRRFAFVELHPSEEPVLSVLRRSGRSEQARLLEALNGEIGEENRDRHVGPSYLMKPEADDDAGRERIWRYDLLPLLEEQFFGEFRRSDIHERFGYQAIKAAAGLE